MIFKSHDKWWICNFLRTRPHNCLNSLNFYNRCYEYSTKNNELYTFFYCKNASSGNVEYWFFSEVISKFFKNLQQKTLFFCWKYTRIRIANTLIFILLKAKKIIYTIIALCNLFEFCFGKNIDSLKTIKIASDLRCELLGMWYRKYIENTEKTNIISKLTWK